MKITRFRFFSTTITVGIVAILFLFGSCKHDGISADLMAPVPFADVQQVYTDYCVKCHSGVSSEGGLDFTKYDGIRNSVTPFNSSKSKSYQAMISTIEVMPPDNAMPTSKRTLVRLWIDQGANRE